MGHVIAVSGKGGVGKTTLCGLLIQYLCESGKRPVLAVDADANANLNEVLGVEPEVTLGELREEIERAGIDPRYQIPSGMTKQAYLEMRLSDAIAEEDDYDLMVMGRTQGQGCYCFVNGLVQTQVQKLQSHYPYIVVDNEAGMEHISRGILPMMEVAILVSDCSRRGVQAAGRIAKLMKELNFKPQKTGLIVNRVPDGKLDAGTLEEIRNQGLELLGVVPHDDQVYQYDCNGKPIIQLLFSRYNSTQGAMMLKIGAIAVVFYTLATVTSSALQGIDKMNVPVKHSLISLVVHIVLVYFMLRWSRLGIYGIVIGNASFPILIFILNLKSLKEYIDYDLEYIRTFLIPLCCSVIMGIAVSLTYKLLYSACHINIVALMCAFVVAGVTYFGTIFLLKKKGKY